MALTLDARARQAVARRCARGLGTALAVGIDVIPARGAHTVLRAEWASARRPQRNAVVRQVGDVTAYVDRRLARFVSWHDVSISAWRLGPFDSLIVVDEPHVMLALQRWERTHPGLALPAA